MVVQIAVVEDEPGLRSLYSLFLKSQGYNVAFSVAGVEESVNAYAACCEKPALIIMDVRLEDGSGIDAARRIFAADPGARFIFATAEADQVNHSSMGGVISVLQKPFSLKELADAIRKGITEPCVSPIQLYPGYA